MRLEGVNCYFCQAQDESRRIAHHSIYGECLEGIGIIIPNGGVAVIDRNAIPVVNDIVHCCKAMGTNSSYLKQVKEIDKNILVGTSYKDKTRDFTFIAEEIRGVVLKVTDHSGNVIWEKQGEQIALNRCEHCLEYFINGIPHRCSHGLFRTYTNTERGERE